MHLRLRHLVVASAVFILLCPSFSFAQQVDLLSQITALNRNLEVSPRVARPQRGTPPATDNTLALLQARQKLVEQLIRTNPAAVRSVMLASETASQLRGESAQYAQAIEQAGSWTGTVDASIADDFQHGRSITHWYVNTGDRRIEMFFPAGMDPRNQLHRNVAVRGVATASVMSVEELQATSPDTFTPALNCTSTGEEDVAVLVMKQPSGGTAYPGGTFFTSSATWPWPQDYFGATPKSANTFWQEASFNATSGAGSIYGPLSLTSNEDCSDTDSLFADAIAAAKADGVDFSNYSRISIIYPVSGCDFGGLGTIGCYSADTTITHPYSITWIPVITYYSTSEVLWGVITHELGHNLGLNHSSSLDFGTIALGAIDYSDPYPSAATASAAVGVRTEYGDPYTVMGGGSYDCGGQYSAFNKSQYLGWLNNTADVMEVTTTGGSYKIAPFENDSGQRALRVLRDPLSGSWLWLEYRQSVGNYDNDFTSCGLSSPNFYDGAAIYYESPYSADGHLFLLDMNPSSDPNNFASSALTPGHSWSDPYSLLTLSVTSADSTGVSVTASYDQPCATLQPSATSFAAASGTGSITVTAPDTCSWTASKVASWITLTGTTSGSGNGTVTFSVAANSGQFQRNGYITVQRQSVALTQAGSATLVSNLSPLLQQGLSGTPAFTFTDPLGAADITAAIIKWQDTQCQVYVEPVPQGGGQTIWYAFLLDPVAYTYSSLVQFGTSQSASNNNCSLSGSTSSGNNSGNQAQVKLGMTFTSVFAGSHRVTASVCDSTGCSSDIAIGTWQVATPVVASISSVTPNSGKQGASVPIAIVGMNTHFGGTSAVTVSGSGVAVSGTSASSATQLAATLTIDANATAGARTLTVTTGTEVVSSTFTINAVGKVQLSTSSLTFGNQNPYSTSASQQVTLTNSGQGTLNISSIVASQEFGVGSTNCGSTLAAAASCNIFVNFQPIHVATRTGTLTITDDAPDSPQTVSLSGYGNFVLPLSRPDRPSRPAAVSTGGTTHIAISKLDMLGIASTGRVTCSGPQGFRCSVKRVGCDRIALTVRTRNVEPGAYTLYLATPDRVSSARISVPVEVKDADANADSGSRSSDRPSRLER